MLRRLWRRTEVGRKQDVFSFSSHKMLFGLFGLDPAGNVICLLQHRANQTAGSWGIVVHDSVSWPLHWYAMQQRHKLRTEDIRGDPRLCKSATVRRFYKFIRSIYLIVLTYSWFLLYLLGKQNALNQDARIVLTELEEAGIKYLDDRIVVGIFGDNDDEEGEKQKRTSIIPKNIAANNTKVDHDDGDGDSRSLSIAARIRHAGKAISGVSFALAEDLNCFDVDRDLDDRYEMNLRRKELLLLQQQKKKRNNKNKKDSTSSATEHVWKVAVLLLGVAAFVVGA